MSDPKVIQDDEAFAYDIIRLFINKLRSEDTKSLHPILSDMIADYRIEWAQKAAKEGR